MTFRSQCSPPRKQKWFRWNSFIAFKNTFNVLAWTKGNRAHTTSLRSIWLHSIHSITLRSLISRVCFQSLFGYKILVSELPARLIISLSKIDYNTMPKKTKTWSCLFHLLVLEKYSFLPFIRYFGAGEVIQCCMAFSLWLQPQATASRLST